MSCLCLHGIEYAYPGGSPVLRGVDVCLHPGELTALLGASGCGKTTLLRCAAGHERLRSGEILLDGKPVDRAELFVPPEQRPVGMVFQDLALFPHRTVAENIAFGIRRWDRASRRERVNHLLSWISLESCRDRYPSELSVGQQQRVALARAMASRPLCLLMDEPFSALDPELRDRLREELSRVIKQEEICCLMVTHDPKEALALADRVLVMHKGRLLRDDTPTKVYEEPCHPRVLALFGRCATVPARVVNGHVESLLGRRALHPHEPEDGALLWVREDGLRPLANPGTEAPTARILGVFRLGDRCRLHVESPDGTLLWALDAEHRAWTEGQTIGLAVDPAFTCLSRLESIDA